MTNAVGEQRQPDTVRVEAESANRLDKFQVWSGSLFCINTREPMHGAAVCLDELGFDPRTEIELYVNNKPSMRGAIWEHLGWRSREDDKHGPRTIQVQKPREFPR